MKRRVTGRTVVVAGGMLATLLLASSCQGGKACYPARGQVFAGGQPAKGALVVFHPTGDKDAGELKPSAHVQKDGSFTLRCYHPEICPTPRDGAPAGEYRVTVTWVSPDYRKYRNVIPDKLQGRYSNPKTSGLQAVVKPEPNELPPFRLEMPGKTGNAGR